MAHERLLSEALKLFAAAAFVTCVVGFAHRSRAALAAASARNGPASSSGMYVATLEQTLKLKAGKATLFLDARGSDLFRRGTIPSAINATPALARGTSENATFLKSVTENEAIKSILLFGNDRSDLATLALMAARLKETNKRVYVYLPGWKEWNSLGLPSTASI